MAALAVDGIILGSIIALGAVGLTLIYGILRFANFSHGDLMAAGAYLALLLSSSVFAALGIPTGRVAPFSFGWPMVLAFIPAMAVAAGVAMAAEAVFYGPMRRRRYSPLMLAITSLAVAFILRSIISIIWGPEFHFYTDALRPAMMLPLDIRIKPDQVFIVGAAAALVVALYLFLQRTKMGKALRATADNPDLARISGIDTERMVMWTWGIGGAMAAAAGILLGIDSQLRPDMGWNLLLPLFAAVILGSIGNPYGALVGGLVIGIAQQMSTAFLLPTYKPAVAFVILILILLLRPSGIFGGRDRAF